MGPAHHAEQLHRFLYETINAGLQRRLVSVLSGKTSSKFRTPIILLEIYYVIGFVPIMFNFDIGIISDITITVGSITKAMIILSLLRMPKVLPGAWKQSNFHVKDSMLMAIGVLDLIVVVISGVTSSLELPVKLLAANLAVVVFAFVFGSVRFRSGKVKVEK